MRAIARFAAVLASAALVSAVPALAKPSHPTHPSHPSRSHKCAVRKVAYIASGTLVSWAATQNSDGTYSGTVTVHVTRANHHAKNDKGNDVTYTLANSRVRFGSGANPPAAGDPVKVIGKVTAVSKKCADQSAAGTVTVRQLVVTAPQTSTSSGS
jgi:hypothetical protein